MFDDDPRVLYVSIHRYDHGRFFPCSAEADYEYVGKGAGKGYTVNVSWNRGNMGDTEYIAAFTNVILPIAYQFDPELVLVSAGFDAARGDPLGGCKVSPEGYAHMTHLLTPLAGGKIILALEGGYNLSSISYSMTLCTKALLGDPLPRVHIAQEVEPSAARIIREVVAVHSAYWSILTPFFKYFPSAPPHKYIPMGSYYVDASRKENTDALVEQMGKLHFEDNSEYGTATSSSDVTPTSEAFSSAPSDLEGDMNKNVAVEEMKDVSSGTQTSGTAELHLSFEAEGAGAAIQNGHLVLSDKVNMIVPSYMIW